MFASIRQTVRVLRGQDSVDADSDEFVLRDDCPQQVGSVDCGFFVIGFMEAIVAGTAITAVTQVRVSKCQYRFVG